MDIVRKRVLEAIADLQGVTHEQVYANTVGKWGGPVSNESIESSRLSSLLRQPPESLTMHDITQLATHISRYGLTDVECVVAANWAMRQGALYLSNGSRDRTKHRAAPWELQYAASQFSIWLGYVAAPALAHRKVFRFDIAVKLAFQFAHLSASREYATVLGGGDGGSDGEIRMMLLSPTLAGITEYWPVDFPVGPSRRSYRLLGQLLRYLRGINLGECVVLRMVSLGVVARHAEVLPVLARAERIAMQRHESVLASAFAFCQKHSNAVFPSLYDAATRQKKRTA